MVQNGKFALWAFPELTQLNNVDFPTFGSPTIPHLRDISIQFVQIYESKEKVFPFLFLFAV